MKILSLRATDSTGALLRARKGVAPVERQNSPAVGSVNPLRVGIGRPIGGAREGLLKVGPEISDVFAADADAQKVIGHDAALGGIAGAALERRLDASEAGGVGEDRDGIHERAARGAPPRTRKVSMNPAPASVSRQS
jgi:hypothetical protein